MSEKKNHARNTLILGVFLVLLCAGGMAVTALLRGNASGLSARVQVDGETVALLPLAEDTELLVYASGETEDAAADTQAGTADTARTDYNLVKVQDGAVFVEEADCPDKICVETGRISAVGEVIACLPHRLIVSVEQ